MQIDINPDTLALPAIVFIPERDLLVHIRSRLSDNRWEVVQDYTVRTIGTWELQALLMSARYWANQKGERRV
jgi:hypothetical protein